MSERKELEDERELRSEEKKREREERDDIASSTAKATLEKHAHNDNNNY